MIAVGWDRQLLHLFRRSSVSGGNLFHQAWDGAQWLPGPTDWENLGGELYSDPAVVSSEDNTLDIFVEGPDNSMLHKQWSYDRWYPGLTDWEVWGEKIAGTPAVVSEVTGVIDLVWLGPDGSLFHKVNDGFGWKPAKKIGGPVAGTPAIVTSHVNVFDIFVRGRNNHLLHKFRNFADWQPAGDAYEDLGAANLLADPAAVSHEAGIDDEPPAPINVLAIGPNQNLLHKEFDGAQWVPGTADWENMGGKMHGTPAMVTRGRNLVDAIVAGPDGALFYIGTNGFGWSPFRPMFVHAKGSPIAVTTGPDRIEVFYIGSDDGVHQKTYDGTGWLEWQDHGGSDL